jgi:hypothetical protein
MQDEKSVKVVPFVVDIVKECKPYEGRLIIKSIDKNGNVFVYDTPNVITFGARDVMSHLLVGDSVTTYKLAYLAVGLNNTAPTRDDTSLANQLLQVPFTNYTFPTTGQVEMTAVLDFTSPANGQVLNEAGLICADGTTLFARQVFGDITKTSSLQLQFIWRIIYT